jgi:hypothetical protein
MKQNKQCQNFFASIMHIMDVILEVYESYQVVPPHPHEDATGRLYNNNTMTAYINQINQNYKKFVALQLF